MGQKHGYGVEVKVEVDKDGEKKKNEVYDGEFREGYRDGFGRISNTETASFHYGYWHRGVMNGTILFYNAEDKSYSVQEYDFGKEVGQPYAVTRPTPELDGYRSVIGDSVIKGEKVHDDDFEPLEFVKDCAKFHDFLHLDPAEIGWPRMSEVIDTSSVQFFPQDKIAEKIEYSPYSNYQLLTVLKTLAEYPTQLMRLFNPLYSAEFVFELRLKNNWIF